MIWHRVSEFIDMLMEVNMLDTGIKTNNMVLVRRNGMMEVNIKGSTRMLPRKDKVNIAGPMVTDM